jgi:hypothetical protein
MTLRLLLLGFFLLVSTHAYADEGRVLVVRSDDVPACVDLAAVARAVGRHAGRAAAVVDAASPGDTSVRLAKVGTTLLVDLQDGGRKLSETIDIDPCDAVPEQIAAFVAGSLSAPPEEPQAEAAPPAPVPSASEDLGQRRRAERAAILADVVDDFRGPTFGWTRFGAGLVGVAGLGSAFLVFGTDELHLRPPGRALVSASAAIGVVGSVTTFALGESDAAEPVLRSSLMLTLGLFELGLGQADDTHERSWGALVAGSSWTAAGLSYGIYSLIRPPVASWRVRRHRELVHTAAARDRITDAQLAMIERDVAAASGPPSWLRPAPFLIGGLVALALLPVYEHDEVQQLGLSINGASLLVIGLALSQPTPFETLRQRLHAASLDLSLAPTDGGTMVGLVGTF